MDVLSDISSVLRIPGHNQRHLTTRRAICLVTEEWMQNIYQKKLKENTRSNQLSAAESSLLLSPSHKIIPKPWLRICIKVIPKSESVTEVLSDGPLYKAAPVVSPMDHLAITARENFRNVWTDAYLRYNPEPVENSGPAYEQFDTTIWQYLHRLRPDIYINLIENGDEESREMFDPQLSISDDQTMQNIVHTIAIVETTSNFFIIQPYIKCTLHDIVAYSPSIFTSSNAKPLFVLYQILQAMVSLHSQGLACGNITLHNIAVDEKLWVYLSQPQLASLHVVNHKQPAGQSSDKSESFVSSAQSEEELSPLNSTVCPQLSPLPESLAKRLSECEEMVVEGKQFVESLQQAQYKLDDLSQLTEDWVYQRISNFKYLMVLNYLAGRRMCDPNHHPVLPWVMDFTSSDSSFRDLKLSKFRLNKGDGQLDFTYDGMSALSGNIEHIPHHVSDVLSDITYYVYKARQTPKHILCSYVRSKWVPNEYPVSMERMYKWTPDECIPEFFIDPTLFASIHEDLPDLELPGWCRTAQDFVTRHMEVLESDQVTMKIHHWIDLTFGYKMSGSSAVKAKNVCLQLVDNHKDIINHGIVQLFYHPHPGRQTINRTFSLLSPRVTRMQLNGEGGSKADVKGISLADNFDGLATLEHFESLHSFSCKTMQTLPPSTRQQQVEKSKMSDLNDNLRAVWRDMQQFGCLVCELFLAPRLHTQGQETSLKERYNSICKLCDVEGESLPRVIRTAASVLLQLGTSPKEGSKHLQTGLLFDYPVINSLGLPPPTPSLLVQPCSHVLPFPEYFTHLYPILSQLKMIDHDIQLLKVDTSKHRLERKKLVKVLARKKVDIVEKYLLKHQWHTSEEGHELILPYIEELYQDSDTVVQAAWSLTSLVSKQLGREETASRLMKYLTKVFNGEEVTPKHMKLYHRTFTVQLLLWLGLRTFLTNFATLLVEAVAGYKDFVIDSGDGQINTEEMEEDIEDEEDGDVFMSEESKLDDTISSVDAELDLEEMGDGTDLRPDLDVGDDREDITCGSLEDEEGEEQEEKNGEEYLHFSMEEDCTSHSAKDDFSTDSVSIDQASERSNESDSLKEDYRQIDRGSADRASIHSVSHIIEAVEQNRLTGSLSSHKDSTGQDEDSQRTLHRDLLDTDLEASGVISLSSSCQSKETEIEVSQSKEGSSYNNIDQSSLSGRQSSNFMVRSETDEFSQIHQSHTINIRDVSGETIKWLSHRLGPLLTAKYLSKNLVRMLALCYLGEDQITVISNQADHLPKSTRLIQGDLNAHKVLECLTYVASLYGEQVILLQYIPCIEDLIRVAKKRLTSRAESGLIAAVVLMRQIIPLLTDKTFISILEDSILYNALHPLLDLVSSMKRPFPSGRSLRSVILYKLIDVLYIIGLRLGFELTRRHMTHTLQLFFRPFDQVYGSGIAGDDTETNDNSRSRNIPDNISSDESYMNIRMDLATNQYTIGSPITLSLPVLSAPTQHNQVTSGQSLTRNKSAKSNYSLSTSGQVVDEREEVQEYHTDTEDVALEMRQTFSPALALAAYIPLTSVFGSHHMEENLSSDDLIRKLCSQYDKALYSSGDQLSQEDSPSDPDEEIQEHETMSSNVEVVGNRICLQEDTLGASPETTQLRKHFQHRSILRLDPDETKCNDLEKTPQRHLRGNWLAYWEHELGLNERDTVFNFKQIKLQTFFGHTNSIRSITCLDNENSFISASKDKTVKLWTLSSFGEGTGRSKDQFTYNQHKKSVFSVAYIENMRLVASCDSTVHIWDPFTGDTVRQLDSSKYSPVIALTTLPLPSTLVVTATTESTLRFLDVRSATYAHEFRCVLGTAGLIRSVAVNSEGRWIAVGFSTGVISLLDLYTGIVMGTWKGHDTEILQLKAYNKNTFLSTSFDLNMKLWNTDDMKEICSFKGHTDPVHCVSFYKDQIVSATTSNKIGVHTTVDRHANFSNIKLRSETFKGVLTSMAILPMNRTLLLGADNGSIRLLC